MPFPLRQRAGPRSCEEPSNGGRTKDSPVQESCHPGREPCGATAEHGNYSIHRSAVRPFRAGDDIWSKTQFGKAKETQLWVRPLAGTVYHGSEAVSLWNPVGSSRLLTKSGCVRHMVSMVRMRIGRMGVLAVTFDPL